MLQSQGESPLADLFVHSVFLQDYIKLLLQRPSFYLNLPQSVNQMSLRHFYNEIGQRIINLHLFVRLFIHTMKLNQWLDYCYRLTNMGPILFLRNRYLMLSLIQQD